MRENGCFPESLSLSLSLSSSVISLDDLRSVQVTGTVFTTATKSDVAHWREEERCMNMSCHQSNEKYVWLARLVHE